MEDQKIDLTEKNVKTRIQAAATKNIASSEPLIIKVQLKLQKLYFGSHDILVHDSVWADLIRKKLKFEYNC